MGHLGNAIAFRLGFTAKWKSSWAAEKSLYTIYTQRDFLVYRYVKSIFTNYTTPLFTRSFLRKDKKLDPKKSSGHTNIINNQLLKNNIAFSNIKITRGTALGIKCYFLDALIEEWKMNYSRDFARGLAKTFNPQRRNKFIPKTLSGYKTSSKIDKEFLRTRLKQKDALEQWRKKKLRNKKLKNPFEIEFKYKLFQRYRRIRGIRRNLYKAKKAKRMARLKRKMILYRKQKNLRPLIKINTKKPKKSKKSKVILNKIEHLTKVIAKLKKFKKLIKTRKKLLKKTNYKIKRNLTSTILFDTKNKYLSILDKKKEQEKAAKKQRKEDLITKIKLEKELKKRADRQLLW